MSCFKTATVIPNLNDEQIIEKLLVLKLEWAKRENI